MLSIRESHPHHVASTHLYRRYWHAGKCWYGEQCRFQHPGPGGVSVPPSLLAPYPVLPPPMLPSLMDYGGIPNMGVLLSPIP